MNKFNKGLVPPQNRKLTRRFTLYKSLVTLYAIWRARSSALNKCIIIFHPPH